MYVLGVNVTGNWRTEQRTIFYIFIWTCREKQRIGTQGTHIVLDILGLDILYVVHLHIAFLVIVCHDSDCAFHFGLFPLELDRPLRLPSSAPEKKQCEG